MNSDNNENEIDKKEENLEINNNIIEINNNIIENNNNIIENNIEINQENNKLEVKEKNEEIILNNNDNNNNNNKKDENPKNKFGQIKIETHDTSENIVTMILDKIISDILVEKRIKDIYKKLPSHCFDYIQNLINPYLKNNFLLYENGLENLSFQKRLLYDRNPINKINEWGMILEPTPPGLDRFADGKNKLIKFSYKDEVNYNERKNDKNNETENDINNSELNNNNENKEAKNESENKIIKEVKEEEANKPKKRKKYKLKKTFGEIVREKKLKEKLLQKENNDIKNNNKNNEIEDENEHSIVLEMTSQDLKNIDMTCALYNDNEENDLLRKEREKLLIEKEKERIKLEKQKKKKKVKKVQVTKDFEPDKLTFDSNGQIIKKRTNLEEIKKDFNKPKLKIIDFNSKSLETPIKERKSIKQKISINRIRSINRNKPIKAKEIKEEKEQIIFNPNDKKDIDVDRIYFRKSSNEAIDISGNNFELVNPEVGVVITNENENIKKEGGFNYLKKYNKPSINDYSKLSYNSQNSRIFSSYMPENNNYNNSNNNSINDNINYNMKDYDDEQSYVGYKEEFSDNNNPLLQGGYQIMTPVNSNKKYNNNLLNAYTDKTNLSQKIKNRSKKQLIHSYDTIKLNNNRYSKSYNSIKLNENTEINNLQSIFLDTDDYDSNNNRNYKSIDNESYVGRNLLNSNRRMKRRRELPIITESNGNKNILNELVDVNEINKFNFLIVKNKKWGNDMYPESPIYQKRSNLAKSQNYLQSEGNMNKFRKSNLNNRIKNSGINIVNNIRQWRKKVYY